MVARRQIKRDFLQSTAPIKSGGGVPRRVMRPATVAKADLDNLSQRIQKASARIKGLAAIAGVFNVPSA